MAPIRWFFSALFLAAAGCGSTDSQVDREPGVEGEAPLSTVAKRLWPSASAIPVCWETAGADEQKRWVKETVESTWQLEANVAFVGWGRCAEVSRGIRITTALDVPYTQGLGTVLDGQAGGMVLNFELPFTNGAGKRVLTRCEGETEACVRTIAVHEFGHALGFAHEQNRTDGPEVCVLGTSGSPGDTYAGKWDLMSVMNYCNPIWTNNGVLSTGDIAGVQQFYGAPESAAVVSTTLQRLEVFRRNADEAIHQQTREKATWTARISRGGAMAGTPAATSSEPGRIDLFVRGVNGVVWQKSLNAGAWSSWTSMRGPQISGTPVALNNGPKQLHLLARGADRMVWYTGSNGTAWSPWTSIGAGAVGSIAAVRSSRGTVSAFWRRDDGTIWTAVGAPAAGGFAFTTAQSLGGPLAGNPTAVSWGDGELAMFSRGRDGAIWFRQASAAIDAKGVPTDAWGSWKSLGGPIAGNPSPVASGIKPTVFARSLDGALWQVELTGTWTRRGGHLFGNPIAVSRGPGLIDVVYRNEAAGLSVHSSDGATWAAPKALGF